jgi:hypothetical protein
LTWGGNQLTCLANINQSNMESYCMISFYWQTRRSFDSNRPFIGRNDPFVQYHVSPLPK